MFRSRFGVIAVALGGILIWVYRDTLGDLVERWVDDPQYSHGFLVPVFAVYLLWSRRPMLRGARPAPSWWGVALLAAGLALWIAGTSLYLSWFAEISLLACAAGLAATCGGRPALRWSWPAVAFLAFMVPLPYRVQTALGGELQRVATAASAYALQTLGAPAVAEGNLILLNDVTIGVVEACSGLGMLVAFFALAAAVALLKTSSPLWQRLVIVASAVPVAVFANVARITVTGVLYNVAQHRLARLAFHDLAGWLMMPLALAILWWELRALRRLMIDCPVGGPLLTLGAPAAAVSAPLAAPPAAPRPAEEVTLPTRS